MFHSMIFNTTNNAVMQLYLKRISIKALVSHEVISYETMI
jgi:hypothetical protein